MGTPPRSENRRSVTYRGHIERSHMSPLSSDNDGTGNHCDWKMPWLELVKPGNNLLNYFLSRK